MARARNPKRNEAKKMWLESGGQKHLKDIAAELKITPSQIRKWKSLDKWSDELKGSAPIEKERYHSARNNRNAAGNTGGAPPGNRNAIGNDGGAPTGNRNALVTGEYETLDFDTMTDEERNLFAGITDDPLITVNTQIRTLKIRQHRIMERLKERNTVKESLTRTVSYGFNDDEGQMEPIGAVGKQNRLLDDLNRLESALDSVNSALLRAVRQKQQLEESLIPERRKLLGVQVKLAENELLDVQEKTGELNMRKQMHQMTVEELREMRKRGSHGQHDDGETT